MQHQANVIAPARGRTRTHAQSSPWNRIQFSVFYLFPLEARGGEGGGGATRTETRERIGRDPEAKWETSLKAWSSLQSTNSLHTLASPGVLQPSPLPTLPVTDYSLQSLSCPFILLSVRLLYATTALLFLTSPPFSFTLALHEPSKSHTKIAASAPDLFFLAHSFIHSNTLFFRVSYVPGTEETCALTSGICWPRMEMGEKKTMLTVQYSEFCDRNEYREKWQLLEAGCHEILYQRENSWGESHSHGI